MTASIDKELIKKKFDFGLNTYVDNACVQYGVSKTILHELVALGRNNFRQVFEIGCGTGFLTQQALDNLHIEKFIVNDIACNSEKFIRILSEEYGKEIDFVCGDAENISFPENNDAIISASTIQWFTDFDSFIDKSYSSLSKGGILAFSTFGEDNFMELKKLTGVGLEYKSIDKLQDSLSSKFNILFAKVWKEYMEFEHPIEVLRHIKLTGVNAIRKSSFRKKDLKSFSENYVNDFAAEKGVRLTYNPIVIIAIKK